MVLHTCGRALAGGAAKGEVTLCTAVEGAGAAAPPVHQSINT